MKLVYRNFKRRHSGACNIWETEAPLTCDHVPLKGGIDFGAVEIDRVAAPFVSFLSVEKPDISYNGLEFRTLCAAPADPVLGQLLVGTTEKR